MNARFGPRLMAHRLRRMFNGEPLLHDYAPVSMLTLPEHRPDRAKLPAIDAHNHLGRWLTADGSWQVRDVPALVDEMQACNLAAMVNLDGRWDAELEANLDRYDRAHPGRFATFCHLDWSVLTESDVGAAVDVLVRSLQRSVSAGACGLKVWKDLGFNVRDRGGELVLPDDPRLSDIWTAAGELGVPVLIHVGDPPAFYEPLHNRNERLEEMLFTPSLRLAGLDVPPLPRLLAALDALVGAHPSTRFIAAHCAGSSENLAWVDELLRRHDNLLVDTAGRMGELGRQPRAAAQLINRHPDRFVWGSDVYPPSAAAWRIAFRFLETDDEHFPYATEAVPPQGRWAIYGLGLPDDVLQKVYSGNLSAVVPALSGGATSQ